MPWRGPLRNTGGGRTTVHFTACNENIQSLLNVNQISLYGAVADLIKELPEDQKVPGRLVAEDPTEQEILTQPPFAQKSKPMKSDGENLFQKYQRKFEKLPEDQKLSKLCSDAGLNSVEIGQYFCALPLPKEPVNQPPYREYTLLRDDERTCVKGIQSNAKFGPVSDMRVQIKRKIRNWS